MSDKKAAALTSVCVDNGDIVPRLDPNGDDSFDLVTMTIGTSEHDFLS
jgi:hypothetical protein